MSSAIMISDYAWSLYIDTVSLKPLMENEIRLVEGVGEIYIALSSSQVDKAIYAEQYSFSIDNVRYSVYARIKALT